MEQYRLVVLGRERHASNRVGASVAPHSWGRGFQHTANICPHFPLTCPCHLPHLPGPCYRCLFPVAPAPENCSRCADAGVLGPVPGVMGVLQVRRGGAGWRELGAGGGGSSGGGGWRARAAGAASTEGAAGELGRPLSPCSKVYQQD